MLADVGTAIANRRMMSLKGRSDCTHAGPYVQHGFHIDAQPGGETHNPVYQSIDALLIVHLSVGIEVLVIAGVKGGSRIGHPAMFTCETGVRLRYMTSPITVIAVHGNGGGAFRFDRVREFIPDTFDFRPITLPGFAAVPRDPSLRTVQDYADHLGTICAQHDRPILLGHGIGGSFALDLMQRQPDLVRGLILEAPVGPALESRKLPRLMNLPGMKPLVQQLISFPPLRPIWTKKFFAPGIPPEFLRRFFAEYRQCSVFGEMFTIIGPTWWNSLHSVSVPTILWWGSEERLLGTDLADAFLKLLPNGSLVIEQGWDHFPMVDRPQEYAQRLGVLAQQLHHSQQP
jgi:pimeloyl-ACP methyl ester carboxylesterase